MKKHVVIVGGGFAGINAAKTLGRNKNFEITLIDKRNYHLFQPLLYQVATAGLSPADIATPIRTIFSEYSNIKVILGNAKAIDLQKNILIYNDEKIEFDYLILACGAKHSYFGHNEWEKSSPGLKTLEQATEIRRRILLAFELAETEPDINKQKAYLTFVIVGGGPTGVEMAGAIAEISRFTLEKDFRNIHPERTRVLLIEAGPRVLAAFDEKMSKKAARDLEKLGVQVWTSTRVTNATEEGVELGGEQIKAKTIIWAAGVEPSSLGKALGVPLDQVGRVLIEEDLSLKNHKNIFVLGDQAHFPTSDGRGLPGLAPVAMQMGVCAARNIIKDFEQRPREKYQYKDKGMMATIGRRMAVLQVGNIKFSGFFAWAAWLFVHIYYLIGFKNRLFVFIQWAWSYFTFRRGARLILDKEWRTIPPKS